MEFIVKLLMLMCANACFHCSTIRQNYHEDVEAAMNDQINMELYAGYVYRSMGYIFSRHDTAMPGFSNFFLKRADKEEEDAAMLMRYQNERGGIISLQDIKAPEKDEFNNVQNAVEDALAMERKVNDSLLKLHKIAGEMHHDPHLENFLEENFLDKQVQSIKELGDLIQRLKKAGEGLGKIVIDQELQKIFLK